MPLKIVFLSWNPRLTDQYLEQMANDNAEQVARFNRRHGRLALTDGTEIISASSISNLQGYRFDQVIVADDRRMEILAHHNILITQLLARCMNSHIPLEYQLQIYDIDAEV